MRPSPVNRTVIEVGRERSYSVVEDSKLDAFDTADNGVRQERRMSWCTHAAFTYYDLFKLK